MCNWEVKDYFDNNSDIGINHMDNWKISDMLESTKSDIFSNNFI